MPRPIALLIACCLAIAACRKAAPPDSVDTVVLFSIDSLRADHVGALGYGSPTTPSIDSLAARGVVFTRAYSTTSWTLPAHVSMLTGLDAEVHGVERDGFTIPATVRTIAERAQAAGIETAGVFSGPYLQPVYGFGRGFRTYANCSGLGSDDSGLGRDWVGREEAQRRTRESVTNPCVRERVAAWARSAPRDGKRFLFVHLWDVHYDYAPPPGYVEIFDADYGGTTDFSEVFLNPAITPEMHPRDLRHLLALYDGEIRWTDDTIAGILADLDGQGMLRNAVVVVTSDHGEEFFEHGGKGHRRTLQDEVLRVPLVVSWPGGPAIGRRSDEVVSLVDVAPAACRWLGLDGADVGTGGPLVDGARGDRGRGRDDALAHLAQGFTVEDHAWVGHRSKAIEHRDGTIEVFGPPEFPASDRKPVETLARGDLDRASELATHSVGALDARVAEAKERARLLHPSSPRPTAAIDDATRQRLESLGYLPRAETPP